MKQKIRGFLNGLLLLLPVLVILMDLALHKFLPDKEAGVPTHVYSVVLIALAVIYLAFILTPKLRNFTMQRVRYQAPILSVVFLLFGAWDIATLKYGLLPLPYFPAPEKTIYALIQDWSALSVSFVYSIRLEFLGYILGASAGLITGVLVGWSRRGNYWLNPVIKLFGPIPATVWIPFVLVLIPQPFVASVILVALAVWFPVAVLTSSGIANVSKSYYEVARTLGADEKYLVLKVAIPAAGPTIFLSLYAGIATSFAALIAAEMIGAKAGLGWYINWHKGWGEYYKVYAGLFVLGLLSTSVVYIVLKSKDRFLGWQKGLIRW